MKGENFSYSEKLMLFAIGFIVTIGASKLITYVVDYFDLLITCLLSTILCVFTSIVLNASENKMNHIVSLFLFVICCVIYAVIHS